MLRRIKEFLQKINKQKFIRNLLISFALISAILIIGNFDITFSRYETDTSINVSPKIAFFIVDVGTTTKKIELERLVPSTTPYQYYFDVSNFSDEKKSNVDLKYTIEVSTTTNLPLNYKIYKVENDITDIVDSSSYVTDENGMYFKKFISNTEHTFKYNNKTTDKYLLWVEFPLEYKNNPEYYESVIDLVEITIKAEQLVGGV